MCPAPEQQRRCTNVLERVGESSDVLPVGLLAEVYCQRMVQS